MRNIQRRVEACYQTVRCEVRRDKADEEKLKQMLRVKVKLRKARMGVKAPEGL